MPSTRIAALASVLALTGLASLAPSALAAWGAPQDVSATAVTPQVATDASGDSALAWEFGPSGGRVQARTMSAAGALAPAFDLDLTTTTTARTPRVAIDAGGNAVFMWIKEPFVLGRRLSASGTLGQAFQVNGGGTSGFTQPDIATDFNGETVFTWVTSGSFTHPRVQARTMTKRGVLGPVRNISPSGQIGRHPQVATDHSGDSVITWVREDGIDGDNDVVQARTMTAASSLGPIMDLSAPLGRSFSPQVASDADGDTTFVWLRFDGRRDRVQGRTMNAAGALGATFDLTAGGTSAVDPQVATDSVGDSVFTWERFEAPNDRIQARTRISGVLGPITNVSAVGGEAFAPQVASSATGASVITWLRFDGANDRVQARTVSAAGALGAITDLSAAGADAETPQVAVAANTGAAVATWERNSTVQVARGP
jgi:hypothetical protein